MSEQSSQLATKLSSVVGSAGIAAKPSPSINGLAPNLLVRPASTGEVAACLGICSDADAAVVVAGRGTWLGGGNPLRRADVVLALERLTGIVEFSAPDLVVTVEAGMALAELATTVASEGLWLPLDPPGAGVSSVGAIVSCNSSGALRGGLGTPRDYVIGLRLAHANGSESRSGGRVAKNVAGYDLNKLYVGSFGTLAVITEVTFKLRPLPESSMTVALSPKGPERLTAFARQVLTSELQPAAFVLTSMPFEDLFGANHSYETLLLRFADNEAAVRYQVDWLRRTCGERHRWAELSGGDEASLWARVNDIDCGAEYSIRMSVPLSQALATYDRTLEEKRTCASADPCSGVVRAVWDGTEDVSTDMIRRRRTEAAEVGGTLFVEKAPASVKRQVGAWSEVGSARGLMKEIKERFDPRGVLNPGLFVADI